MPSDPNSLSLLPLDELERLLRLVEDELETKLRLNPLKLIRHPVQGILPLRLFARQREFLDRLAAVQKVMGWVGPNRAGKSIAAAVACVAAALGLPATAWPGLPDDLRQAALGPPVSIGCITISREKSIDGQQKYLAQRLPEWMLTSKPWTKRTGFGGSNCSISLINGSTFDFLSDLQRDQAFEAFSWSLCWIDEAVDEWVVERIYARLVDTGGKLLHTSVLEKAWQDRLFNMRLVNAETSIPAPPGLIDNMAETTMFDNELLDRTAIEQTIALFGGPDSRQARMRVFGQNVMREGLVFDTYDPLAHEQPALDLTDQLTAKQVATWTRWEGADPGYANPFAWLFVAIDAKGVIHCVDELYLKRSLVPAMAAAVKQKRKAWGYDDPYRATRIDPAADQEHEWGKKKVSVRRELLEAGVVTLPGEAGPGSVDAGCQLIRALLAAGRLVIHDNCVWLKYEFQNFREGPKDRATGEYLGDREKKVDAHNHLIAALRYLLTGQPHHVPLEVAAPQPGSWAADLAAMEAAEARRSQTLFDD